MKKRAVFAAALLLVLAFSGCAGKEPKRERETCWDDEWISGYVTRTLAVCRPDIVWFDLRGDVNAAARGEYLGVFRTVRNDPMLAYMDLERYDLCSMYAFSGAPTDQCFLIDNGGQFILAVMRDGSYALGREELAETHLLNVSLLIDGRPYCSAAAVDPAGLANGFSVSAETYLDKINVCGSVVDPARAVGFLFAAHPREECVILSDGNGAILFASTEYLSGHGAELIPELEKLGSIEKG